MPLFVIRNFLRQLRDEVRTLRSRPNEIHIAAKDAPKLRNFIDANFANDAPDPRHSLVVGLGPDGAVFFGVYAHRSKLHQRKRPAVLADALLFVEYRPARIDLD